MASLILSKADPFDFPAVAKVLAGIFKVPFVDAVHQAKRGWGILAEDVEEVKARDYQEAFKRAGLETHITATALAAISAPQRIASIKFDEVQTTCTLKDGGSVSCASSDVTLISGCAVQESHSVTVTRREGPSAGQKLASIGILMATGIPLRIGPKKQIVSKKQDISETVFFLDVFLNGSEMHLRIDGQRFDYSCLGSKKQYNVAANFKFFVKEWARFAPRAWQGRGTHILVQDKPISEMGYRSLDDLDHESRWLLSLPKA